MMNSSFLGPFFHEVPYSKLTIHSTDSYYTAQINGNIYKSKNSKDTKSI